MDTGKFNAGDNPAMDEHLILRDEIDAF